MIIGKSDTVAWFSDNSLPSDFTIEHFCEDSVRLNWLDNSYGEYCYVIDKKVEDGSWLENYTEYSPEANNGFNNEFQIVDFISNFGSNIYYRLRIKMVFPYLIIQNV